MIFFSVRLMFWGRFRVFSRRNPIILRGNTLSNLLLLIYTKFDDFLENFFDESFDHIDPWNIQDLVCYESNLAVWRLFYLHLSVLWGNRFEYRSRWWGNESVFGITNIGEDCEDVSQYVDSHFLQNFLLINWKLLSGVGSFRREYDFYRIYAHIWSN